MALEIDTFDQYFDDLESFAWVLFWALIEIAKANKKCTPFDQALMKYLNGDDLPGLRAGKGAIVEELKSLSERVPGDSPNPCPTSLLVPFIQILDCWFNLVKPKEGNGGAKTLPPSEESTVLYKAFITVAMEKMDDLPEAW